MADARTVHEDNDTPTATIPEGDTQIQGEIKNTPFLADGSTGNSLQQGVRGDAKWAGESKEQ
jgi:hypothetical protein